MKEYNWIFSILAVFVLCTLEITANQLGQACSRFDQQKHGTCRDLQECMRSNTIVENKSTLQVCESNTLETVNACCRKSSATIAQEKCNDWKRVANTFNGNRCTITQPLVRGGTEAAVGEFPHVVSLLQEFSNERRKHVCRGTLISENFVLTAAHCRVEGRRYYARIGVHDHSAQDPEVKDFVVDSFFSHGEYNPPSRYYDIALIRLRGSVTFTNRVRPACLPYKNERLPPFTQLTVAGWGAYKERSASDVLRKSEVSVLDRLSCDKKFIRGNDYEAGITDSIICGDERVGGTCKGDSGGPLMVKSNTQCDVKEVTGIVSRGIPSCAPTDIPATYTKVEYYLDWIVENVWKNEL